MVEVPKRAMEAKANAILLVVCSGGCSWKFEVILPRNPMIFDVLRVLWMVGSFGIAGRVSVIPFKLAKRAIFIKNLRIVFKLVTRVRLLSISVHIR